MSKECIPLNKCMEDEKLKDEIAQHLINYQKYLNIKKHYEKEDIIKLFIKDEKTKVEFSNMIEKEIFQLKGKRVLDIGCGKGGVAISCALRGANAFGFDADADEIKIAKKRAKSYGINNILIFKGDAENMPFPDDSFELVTATGVLEHVKNSEKNIKEMIRVTKHRGFCCISTPNPLFPREGHYKVFYMPYLPKSVGKIYLRLRGFNPDFFMKHVTYPYPSISKIEKIFRENGMDVQNITERDILMRFNDPISIKDNEIKSIIKYLKKLRVNNFVANVIVRFHFYPGAFIIAKKGEMNDKLQ